MNKVVHFEIPVDDLERAKKFYGIFDWELTDMPGMNYTLITTVPVDQATRMPTEPGAINGGMMKRAAQVPTPVVVVEVESIDGCLPKLAAAGGKMVMPKTAVADMGYVAYVKDTEGNVLGLWENKK